MQIAKNRYNPYVVLIENAQSDVREIVKNAFLTEEPKATTEKKLITSIRAVTSKITIKDLRSAVARSLGNYANVQRKSWKSIGLSPVTIYFLLLQSEKKKRATDNVQPPRNATVKRELKLGGTYEGGRAFGVPLGKYYDDVWKKQVKPVLDELSRERALDPDDYSGHNSLRNRAEMEVRYHDHLDSEKTLREGGVKLVVASSHADCSKRCAPWQGRIYSLDHTSGRIDGHYYVPLEEATDVWYTTKAGKRYKNGLLGFNCRHRIEEYKGELLPRVSEQERKSEYAITERQRVLENVVRKWKYIAETALKKADIQHAKRCADIAYDEYLKFCKENDRPAYPMRVRI